MITEVHWTVTASGFRVHFQPQLGVNYFDWPLTYDAFTTGASEYDIASDEIYCPCGATLPWDGDAGDLLRRVDGHCKADGHPMPQRSEDLP